MTVFYNILKTLCRNFILISDKPKITQNENQGVVLVYSFIVLYNNVIGTVPPED